MIKLKLKDYQQLEWQVILRYFKRLEQIPLPNDYNMSFENKAKTIDHCVDLGGESVQPYYFYNTDYIDRINDFIRTHAFYYSRFQLLKKMKKLITNLPLIILNNNLTIDMKRYKI